MKKIRLKLSWCNRQLWVVQDKECAPTLEKPTVGEFVCDTPLLYLCHKWLSSKALLPMKVHKWFSPCFLVEGVSLFLLAFELNVQQKKIWDGSTAGFSADNERQTTDRLKPRFLYIGGMPPKLPKNFRLQGFKGGDFSVLFPKNTTCSLQLKKALWVFDFLKKRLRPNEEIRLAAVSFFGGNNVRDSTVFTSATGSPTTLGEPT